MSALEHYLTEEVDPMFIAGARDHLLPFLREGAVINVGVGYGTWDSWLATSAVGDVTCLDIDDTLLDHFRKRYPELTYVCADATTWTPRERVSTVVASHLLEHLDDPVAALRFWRTDWLAPGGRVLIVVPNANSLHRWIGQKMGFIEERTDLDKGDHKLGHRRVYTSDLLATHIEEAGFRCLQLGTVTMKPLTNAQLAAMPRPYVEACIDMGSEVCGDRGCQIAAVLEVPK